MALESDARLGLQDISPDGNILKILLLSFCSSTRSEQEAEQHTDAGGDGECLVRVFMNRLIGGFQAFFGTLQGVGQAFTGFADFFTGDMDGGC